MEKSRTHYVVLNSTVSSLIYIVNIFIKFISRSIFVHFLSKEYLGINTLLLSLVGILSLSELGIGQAIIYSLYEPLATKNFQKIKALVELYKKIYAVIGGIVALLGLFLFPVLPLIVKNNHVSNLSLIFFLFLLNSVVSYFYSYNTSLLSADQKNYIVTLNNFCFQLILFLSQTIILIMTHNFIYYLVSNVVFTILSNISLGLIVKKKYSFLYEVTPCKIGKSTYEVMIKNTIGNFLDKIGSTVVNATDNIYISMFSSVALVGIYNNYYLIVSSILSFINQISLSVLGSIGNLAIENDSDKSYKIFINHNFINYLFIYIFSVPLLHLSTSFVGLWVGKTYALPKVTVLLIAINFILQCYRNTALTFNTAYGLSWYTKWKVIVECIANVGFSALFLIKFHMGINGVILGTICSSILVVEWWEPYALFKYGFKISIKPYLLKIPKQVICLGINIIVVSIIINNIEVLGWFSLFYKAICSVLLSLILFVFMFRKSDEFKYTVNMIKKILHRR